jgi:hypothetical protein
MQVTVKDNLYSLSKLPAIKQFHVARRIAPLLTELAPLLKKGTTDPLDALIPAVNALQKLSDDDSEYVLYSLLNCASIKQPAGGFAPVCVDKVLMFKDLPLDEMLELAGRAFLHNLGNFFSTAQPTSQGASLKKE